MKISNVCGLVSMAKVTGKGLNLNNFHILVAKQVVKKVAKKL